MSSLLSHHHQSVLLVVLIHVISLQYYADYTNFTSNSLFLIFLPGEHRLDSVVEINKVANLSLEGVNSEVKIFCSSFPSGFNISEFIGLSIKVVTVLKLIMLQFI